MSDMLDELLKTAKGYYVDKKYEEAMRVYEEVLKIEKMEPRSSVVSNIALCLFNLEKYEECSLKCLEALELNPHNYKASYRLMLSREKQGQIGLALEAGRKCAEIARDEKHHLPIITELTQKWRSYLRNLEKLVDSNEVNANELIKLVDLVDHQDVKSKLFLKILNISANLERSNKIKCWNFISKCSTSNGHLNELLDYLDSSSYIDDIITDAELSNLILTTLHTSYFENEHFWSLLNKFIKNNDLVESVFRCVVTSSQNKPGKSVGHWIQEMRIFLENVYSIVQRHPESSKPVLVALLKNEAFDIDFLKNLFHSSIDLTWIVAMDSLFIARREVAREIMFDGGYIKQILESNMSRKHIKVLSKAAEFAELRAQMLGNLYELNKLVKKFGPLTYTVIGKLLIHDKEAESKLSFFIKIKEDFKKLLNVCGKIDELALESLVFISLHEDVKKSILYCDISKIIAIGNKLENSLHRFLFISFLLNIIMGEDDKTEMDNIARINAQEEEGGNLGSSLDMSELYNNLPDMAKYSENGYFLPGSQEMAKKVCEKLLSHESGILVRILTQWKPSDSLAAFFMLLSNYSQLRQHLSSNGVIGWINKYLSTSTNKAKRYYGRALYKICSTSNPRLLSYKDALDSISHIISYLDDSHELHQYEAALALTNLASISTETRNRCLDCGAWEKLENLLFNDNEELKAAGIEGWSNLCLDAGGRVHEKIFKKLFHVLYNGDNTLLELNIILAFIVDYKNNYRCASAGASGLALLSMDLRIARMMTRLNHFSQIFEVANETEDIGILERLFTLFGCIAQLEPEGTVEGEKGEEISINVATVQDQIRKVVDGKKYSDSLSELTKSTLNSTE